MPRLSPKFVSRRRAKRIPAVLKLCVLCGEIFYLGAATTVRLVVRPGRPGPLRLEAMVAGDQPDPTPGDDRAALSIAEQRLEQVRAAGFGSPTLPDPREETAADGVQINNQSDADAVPGFRRRTIITGVCPTNFAIAWNDGACPPPLNPGAVEAKLVTVMVRMKEPGSNNTDVQTRPVILSTVLVRR